MFVIPCNVTGPAQFSGQNRIPRLTAPAVIMDIFDMPSRCPLFDTGFLKQGTLRVCPKIPLQLQVCGSLHDPCSVRAQSCFYQFKITLPQNLLRKLFVVVSLFGVLIRTLFLFFNFVKQPKRFFNSSLQKKICFGFRNIRIGICM